MYNRCIPSVSGSAAASHHPTLEVRTSQDLTGFHYHNHRNGVLQRTWCKGCKKYKPVTLRMKQLSWVQTRGAEYKPFVQGTSQVFWVQTVLVTNCPRHQPGALGTNCPGHNPFILGTNHVSPGTNPVSWLPVICPRYSPGVPGTVCPVETQTRGRYSKAFPGCVFQRLPSPAREQQDSITPGVPVPSQLKMS